MPNFAGRGAPGLELPAKALADMLASALRGGAKATLGLPGDIEGLGRMGLNFAGAGVSPEPALPNTDYWDKKLPPTNAMPGFDTVEKLGEFLPLPTGAAALMSGAKKAGTMVKALRTPAEGATDLGRREFLKDTGMGAGALAATSVAPMAMVKALRGASEAAPLAQAAPLAPLAKAAPLAAKVASNAWSPEALMGALQNINRMNGEEATTQTISKYTAEAASKHFANPEELKNADGWIEHWSDELNPNEKWVEDFDADAAGALAKDEAARLLKVDVKNVHIDDEGTIYTYSVDPKQQAVIKKINDKHFPKKAINPEWARFDKAEKFIDGLPISEIDKVLKTRAPGDLPPEWAAKGVTPEMVAYRAAPIRGSIGSPRPEDMSSIEKVSEPLGADAGLYDRGDTVDMPGGESKFVPAPKFKWNTATQSWEPQ